MIYAILRFTSPTGTKLFTIHETGSDWARTPIGYVMVNKGANRTYMNNEAETISKRDGYNEFLTDWDEAVDTQL